MRRFTFLFALFLVFIPLSAHADTVTTYNLTGVSTFAGSTVTGTITVDSTIGQFTAIDAIYNSAITGQMNTFTTIGTNQSSFFNDGFVVFVDSDQGTAGLTGGAQLAFLFPYESLVNYPGSLICAFNYSCNNVISTVYYTDASNHNASDALCTGGLGVNATPDPCSAGTQTVMAAPVVSTTPEPSSLILLGTGVLGIVSTGRRPFIRT